jgi:hypothetical protein
LRNRICAASVAAVPNQKTGDGCSVLHPFFDGARLAILIVQVLAFVAVLGLAIAPRTLVPLLRGAIILYALGMTP